MVSGKQREMPRKLSKVQREKQSDVESKDQKMEARKYGDIQCKDESKVSSQKD